MKQNFKVVNVSVTASHNVTTTSTAKEYTATCATATSKQLAVSADAYTLSWNDGVTKLLFEIGYIISRTPQTQAVGDLALITFPYLLYIG